jgi:undecaprenyl diphosphate synthase
MDYLLKIDRNKTPKHVAIIMDGNGRWAQKQGHDRLYGHNFGVESVRESLKAAKEIGVEYLTLYAFSTENWNRPKDEVDGLMNLLVTSLANEIKELSEGGVKISAIGDLNGLPEACQNELLQAMNATNDNKDIHLILALNYSSKWEITQAVNQLMASENLKLPISAESIEKYLTTNGIPDPELLIRTSGEHRVSNFLLWQIAYTEFHFTDVLWPDFKKEDFFKAVLDYQSRERRFGMLSEQLI